MDKIPGLSITSKRKYAEKNLSLIFSILDSFFLLLKVKKYTLPLEIDEISDTKAEVVAAGPAPAE